MTAGTYLDTSVVAAYYVSESFSTQAQAIYETQAALAISDFVELEFFSALSSVCRGDLERSHVERVAGLFLEHLAGGWYTRIHLNAEHYSAARRFIATFDLPLKSPDALHLAVSTAEDLSLVTADRQLARNAETLGITFQLVG